jgi:hypothetical protein
MDLLFYIVLSAALVAGIITQLKWAQVEDLALPHHADEHRPKDPVLRGRGQRHNPGDEDRGRPPGRDCALGLRESISGRGQRACCR